MADLRVLARVPDRVDIYSAKDGSEASGSHSACTSSLTFLPDGKFVSVGENTVTIIKTDSNQEVLSIPEAAVTLTAVSPAGGYLVTCQRPSKEDDGSPSKNLKVWDLASGTCVLSLSCKTVTKETWPILQWTADDSHLFHMVTNTLHVYSKEGNFAAYTKVTIKGIGGFAVSPGSAPRIAAFIPESKAAPAAAGVYDWTQAEPAPLTRKSFFRCQGSKLLWNKTGSAVLVLSYADYDATNKSYYGEQKLFYLPADSAKADEAVSVPLPKEGPVHDVQWDPTGNYFVAVAGFMPAKVTLFDAKCKPVYDLGSGPYNLARWNPFGRFLVIAGFGNLPGDIIFYDKKTSGALKQMGAVRHPSVTAEWAPDGRHLLVATTAPRLRVDNGYKIFTYYGAPVASRSFPTLFDATWVPVPAGTFEDRPQSPERLAASATSSGSGAAASAAPAKPASYVPPQFRGSGAPAPSGNFSLSREADDKPGRIGVGSARRSFTPGAEFVTPAAGKNAKKRSRKKKQPGDKQDGGSDGEGEEGDEGAVEALQQGTASLSLQEQQQQQDLDPEATAKRIRNLQKKLRQIADIKAKIKEKGEAALEPEQVQKAQSEAAVLAELASLGWTPETSA